MWIPKFGLSFLDIFNIIPLEFFNGREKINPRYFKIPEYTPALSQSILFFVLLIILIVFIVLESHRVFHSFLVLELFLKLVQEGSWRCGRGKQKGY